MAKANLKAAGDDEFVLTISDTDEDKVPDLDAEAAGEIGAVEGAGNRKRKRGSGSGLGKKAKKTKTQGKDVSLQGNREAEAESGEEAKGEGGVVGLWGAKDEDDGAMDSEFEFQLEGPGDADGDGDMADFEGWGLEAARKGLENNGNRHKRAVDIDDIIRRRREKKGEAAGGTAGHGGSGDGDEDEEAEEGENEEVSLEFGDEEEGGGRENEEVPVNFNDDENEFLAEDGFGMGVTSDVEETGDEDEDENLEKQSVESEEGRMQGISGSDGEDSVASPAPHPDDLVSESSEDEKEDDLEETARREAFFAPDDKPSKSAKSNGTLTFQNMSLSRPIHRGLAAVGFSQPTPIQAKTIPVALLGKDVVGGAVTGSGKTAAFIVPILERLLYRPKKVPTSRVAILMPTRELAIQCHAVAMKLASYTDIKFCLAVGGLSLKVQEAELRLRPDVIIATPGRFIDHMRNSASFTVDTLEILVLDEADRMLEDGFADELNEILITIPKSRQTMLFSATMTSSVDKLIRVGLNKPVRLMVDAQKQTVGTLVQEFVRLRPGREGKRMGYLLYLCTKAYTDRVIVFFRQKKEAHRARIIFGLTGLKAAELHGSMSQEQRITSVEAFRDNKVSFLLATDLASRGLDIKGVNTVLNYEAPQSHEIYLHRVGRTARAGRSGRACTLAAEPDRKVVKAAVKAGRAQGAKIASRVVDTVEVDAWAAKVDSMADEIEAILAEEKEDKQLAQAEMQVRRGENLIVHEDEIKARPKRTWFESEADKRAAKKIGRAELNRDGAEAAAQTPKKREGKLSNKDKKRLDDTAARKNGKVWKKGREEREGKSVLGKGKGKGGRVMNGKKKNKKIKSGKPARR